MIEDERFQEALRRTTEEYVRRSGKRGVRLHGGPQDGWLVLPDAPNLRANWYTTWPESIAAVFRPGRYAVGPGGLEAIWVSLDDETE
jgi:hypothetical protein